ncbi:MAG: carbamoyltransferase [Deltaproteobacteria bacterium]|nr:carbamoyltransferase [Deltaproteobacteria bacterium]
MNILGLHYWDHDSTACIVSDGKLLIAIEEERLTRRKHIGGLPKHAINKCLKITGFHFDDIDYIAVSIQPNYNWFPRMLFVASHPLNLKPFNRHVGVLLKQLEFWRWYKSQWPKSKRRPEVELVPHHLAHVAGAFFVSPYDRAALLAIDGAGEWATSWLGYGEGNTITCFNQSYFPMSLGSFYEAVTQFCGFQPICDEGKTMGLAAFGDASRYQEKLDKIINIDKKGNIHFDLSYFRFQFPGSQLCSQKFFDVFGKPRISIGPKGVIEQHHMDVAAACQKVLEEKVLQLCHVLQKRTNTEYLVIAGGVSLNSVMNGRIVKESAFKDLYVMPAAGDNGTAIGAAFYLYNSILKKPRVYVHADPYIGTSYSDEEISSAIAECKLKAERHEDITGITAKLLHEGRIIGWFQGRMEIGPRALGNRSILANATLPDMKAKINAEVKHREAFRPFAPAIPIEHKNDYFDLEVAAPFMLKVCNVLSEKQAILPSVTHADGTARLQTVERDSNPLFYELLTRFGELSGVPVLLNTSFNVMGEPIVESPFDAIRCFYSTGIDYLMLGNYIISK